MESECKGRQLIMKVYDYKNYDEYVSEQTRANKEKISWRYVHPSIIKRISEHKGNANFIICHGTRSGAEQKWFKDNYPNAYIIGTEISETAWQFEMTIQHDFAKVKDEWIGKADIVYSNSFDHSIDPQVTINTWRDQLKDDGTMYLEYSESESVCESVDCLLASQKEIVDLINKSELIMKETFKGSKGSNVLVCKKVND